VRGATSHDRHANRAHFTALLAAGSVLYVLSASFYYVVLAVDARRRAEKQTLELALLSREAELKALKARRRTTSPRSSA
jgi:hypothetical protein